MAEPDNEDLTVKSTLLHVFSGKYTPSAIAVILFIPTNSQQFLPRRKFLTNAASPTIDRSVNSMDANEVYWIR